MCLGCGSRAFFKGVFLCFLFAAFLLFNLASFQNAPADETTIVSEELLVKQAIGLRANKPRNLHIWISDYHDAVTADLLATWVGLNISHINITWSWHSLSPYCQFFNSCPQNLSLIESILGNRWQTNPVAQAEKAYAILQQIPDFMRADIGMYSHL